MKILVAFLTFVSVQGAFTSSQPRNVKGRVKGTQLDMTVLSYGGKKRNFKAGSSLKSAASALGVKPKYSCRK